MTSVDLDGAHPWLDVAQPVPAVHLLRAARVTGRDIHDIAARLTVFGYKISNRLGELTVEQLTRDDLVIISRDLDGSDPWIPLGERILLPHCCTPPAVPHRPVREIAARLRQLGYPVEADLDGVDATRSVGDLVWPATTSTAPGRGSTRGTGVAWPICSRPRTRCTGRWPRSPAGCGRSGTRCRTSTCACPGTVPAAPDRLVSPQFLLDTQRPPGGQLAARLLVVDRPPAREQFPRDRRSMGGPSSTHRGLGDERELMDVVTRQTAGGTDAEIIRRMHSDPEAFATVFDRYYPAIHAYAARRLGRDLADDVAAEVFLVAFDQFQRYDTTQASARPWLFGIASNLIAGHRRAEARRYRAIAGGVTGGDEHGDGHADRVAVRLDAQALRGRLAAALAGIAPPDREVLLLVAWADLSCEETARALGVPAGTVRSRLHRARKKLRAALGGADPTALRGVAVIDEMAALREGWTDPEPPSPAAQSRARTALLARAAHARLAPNDRAAAGARQAPTRTRTRTRTKARRRWGWAWTGGLAITAAVAVVAGLLHVGGFGRDGDSRVGTPSELPSIELAAAYAAAQPFTAPRPDQWTYLKFRMTNPGTIARSKGQQTDITSEQWIRADGEQTADRENGTLQVHGRGQSQVFPPQDYATLAGLPTEPEQVLDWIREHEGTVWQRTDLDRFNVISKILSDNLLPPTVTAALLRALGLIPGVFESPEPIEVDGHPVAVVGIVLDGWLESDILLDPGTHEFIGTRSVAIADHTFTVGPQGAQGDGGTSSGDGPDAAPVGGPTDDGATVVRVGNGELQSLLIRSAIRIVDAPGRTG